jgi:Holliday junction DNA helicase RuvA
MFNYFKGHVIAINKTINNRYILILEVGQIGYEIQITSHLAQALECQINDIAQIFTHTQIKEELPIVYGFATVQERDLFRQLIGVSSIGAQLASSLIDGLGFEQLIEAIVSEKVASLVKVPGIGKKTAERIILELKDKLTPWYSDNLSSTTEILQELQVTLEALGYENRAINQAIKILITDESLLNILELEQWLKRAIIYLDS